VMKTRHEIGESGGQEWGTGLPKRTITNG
jgi:hypothetical protein